MVEPNCAGVSRLLKDCYPIVLVALLGSPALALEPGDEFRDCAVCPVMVVLPAGSFVMGSPESEAERSDNEGPRHQVTIGAPIAVGKYEVTFEQWDACVDAGGCDGHRASDNGLGRENRAVFNVSWLHARSYVDWLTRSTGEEYRLPSEAEWEYAARAGTTEARYWGNSADDACKFANAADLTTQGISPEFEAANCSDGSVFAERSGSFAPNDFALHDMLGNVFEAVEDCWNDSYRGAPQDGTAWREGDCSRHALRGGSWGSKPSSVRSAYRGSATASSASFVAGFRVARSIVSSP